MTSKHTPAPWELVQGNEIGIPMRIKSNSFGIIARLNDILPTENGYEENKANAYLIAAAPELLDALLIAKDCIEDKQAGDECIKALIVISNAILKARGEA